MTSNAQAGARRWPSVRVVMGLLAALAMVLVALGWAETQGLSKAWIGSVLLLFTLVLYASIGFLSRTTASAEYFVAGRRVPALYNGMATAADWLSAASFMGLVGTLYVSGFGGLAFVIGWTGGFCLLIFLLAPYLRRSGQITVPGFLAARYGSSAVRVVAALATVLCSFTYVVAQIYGVGLITARLTGLDFTLGTFLGLGGVLLCSFLGGMRAITWTQVAQCLIVLLALAVPAVWLAAKQTGVPVPMWAAGQQLERLTQLEADLISDPAEQSARAAHAAHAEALALLIDGLPGTWTQAKLQAQAQLRALKANGATLDQLRVAESQLASLPDSADAAKRVWSLELEQARLHAMPLAGMPRHAQPFAQEAALMRSAQTPGDAAAKAPVASPAEPQPAVLGPNQPPARFGVAEQQASPALSDAAVAPGGVSAVRSGSGLETRADFLALIFCLVLGTAGLPHLLARSYTTPSVSEARYSVVWALFFIGFFYITASSLAVMVKFELMTQLVGQPMDRLPEWLGSWARLNPLLVSVQDVNGDGVLQLAELQLAPELIMLASPEMAGMPQVISALVAAGAVGAALSTADGLLLAISSAISHDVYHKLLRPNAVPLHRVLASKMVLLCAALVASWVAVQRPTDILQLVAAVFSFAAACFVPALVLGVFWARANAWGALAGMLGGGGVVAYYLAVNHPGLRGLLGVQAPIDLWWGIAPISAGVLGVPVALVLTVLVSLLTPPAPARQMRWLQKVRSAPEAHEL
jgi:cation/acetate symporter